MPAVTIIGSTPADDFTLAPYQDNETFGATTPSQVVINDLTLTAQTSASSISKQSLLASTSPDNPALVFTSETEAVCSVNSNGKVTRNADGVCTVRCRGKTGSRKHTQTLTLAGGITTYDSIDAFGAGSLREYLHDQTVSALSGVTAGSTSQRAFAAGGYVYDSVNTSNFLFNAAQMPADILASVLATPGAPANSKTWISPHHYISALGTLHGTLPAAGRRLLGVDTIVWWSATPWGGSLAKVLPANWLDYAPDSPIGGTSYVGTGLYCFARMYNLYDVPEHYWVMPVEYSKNPFQAGHALRGFQKQKTSGDPLANGGDSGSPVFCGIGGDLVILSHVSSQGLVGYDRLSGMITEINSAMNELAVEAGDAGSYALQTVDISGFTSYP